MICRRVSALTAAPGYRSRVKKLPVVLLLSAALMLTACGPEPTPTPTPTDSASASPTPTETATPTPTPTPTPTVKSGWNQCPAIVKRLNASGPDDTAYVEIPPERFMVQRVGTAVLSKSCVIDVVVSGEPVTWAVLPGDQALADGIVRELLGGGYVAKGGDVYANNDAGLGVLVRFSGTGATLDSSLSLTNVFKPYVEKLVFMSTYSIS